MNHEEIGKHSERIMEIKTLMIRYNLEGINFTSEKDDWKKIETNDLIIALNVLYAKKEKIDSAYISKHN